MKKRITVLCLVSAMSVSAAKNGKDPKAYTDAFIDFVSGSKTKVKGKAYAYTENSKMKKINVFGTFYKGSKNGKQIQFLDFQK